MLRVFVENLIIEYTMPLSSDVAFMISILYYFIAAIRLWQFFMVVMVRYILVFYHTHLNAFDEKDIRRFIRIFVCIFSAIPALAESKTTLRYQFLSSHEYQYPYYMIRKRILSPILFIITFTALIFTQYRIEKFKKTVDSGQWSANLKTEEKCMDQMNFNIYRIELITAALTLLAKGIYYFSHLFGNDDLKLKLHRGALFDQALTLIFSFMFIYKNEKVRCFFKHRILSLLLCQCYAAADICYSQSNAADRTNIYAIYNPEDYPNLNFDKTKEEIVTQHHDNQFGPHETNEFSSVIFVTERGQKQEKKRALLSKDKENNMNHYDEPKPGCSHWSDNHDPYKNHNNKQMKRDIVLSSKNQSLPKMVSI